MSVNRKRLCVVAFNFIILFVLYSVLCFTWAQRIGSLSWIQGFSAIAIMLMVTQIVSFKALKIQFSDIRCLFIFLSYLFLLGRYFVYAMGQDENYNLFFYRYTNSELYKTAIYSLAFIQAFFLGLISFSRNLGSNKFFKNDGESSSKTLYSTGIIIFLISFPCEVYRNIIIMMAQSATDSYIAENLVDINGVVTALGRLSAVAIIFIVCSLRLNKRNAIMLVCMFIGFEMVFSVFTGARSYAVIAAIVLVICLTNMYRIRISGKIIVAMIVFGYLGVCFISAVSEIRSSSGVTISIFLNSWMQKIISGNIFYEILVEFGNTQNTIGMGIRYFEGTNNFYNGTTLVLSWLTVIPGIKRLIPEISLRYNPIDIMKEFMPGYYFGGSLPLDTYINFGKFGIIASLFLGLILSKIMRVNPKKGLSTYGLYYGMYYIFLRMVRCGVSEVMRLLVYMFIIYYAVNLVMVHRFKIRGVQKCR